MGTGVASLEAGALVGFPITRLRVSLYVATQPGESSRGLTTLPGGLFHGLTSVKVLDFSGQFLFPPNPLTTLEAGVFEGLDALEELDLSRNRLATLDVGAFDELSSLKTLDLSDNKLASLNVGVFRGLSSLTSLDLSINELTSLEAGMFGNLTSLDMLSLHSNPLTKIESSVFAHPVNLENLELPPSTAVPASSLSEEWACSANSRVSTCSVRTTNGTDVLAVPPTAAPATPDRVTPTLTVPRFAHEAVLLDDGRVLVGGGFTGVANNNFIAPFPLGSVQLYQPEQGMWSIVEPPEGPPGVLYSAIELADGRVLFIGLGGDDEGMASLFDPASGSWTSLPGLSSQRGFPNLVLLDDGRVLVAGGLDFGGSTSSYSPEIVNTVEVFDPTTGDWQQAASMSEVSEDQWLFSLNDGRVIAIGVLDDESSDATAHAEIYDPAADTWTVVSSLEPYYAPTDAVELSDGRLLVFGALSSYSSMSSRNGATVHVELPDGRQLNAGQFAEQFPGAKIYDPVKGAWTPAGGMALARVNASLTLLRDGRVLVSGGEDPAGSEYVLYATSEIFDPLTNTWSPGPDLSEPRSDHTATLLPDGTGSPGRRDRDELGEPGEIPSRLSRARRPCRGG